MNSGRKIAPEARAVRNQVIAKRKFEKAWGGKRRGHSPPFFLPIVLSTVLWRRLQEREYGNDRHFGNRMVGQRYRSFRSSNDPCRSGVATTLFSLRLLRQTDFQSAYTQYRSNLGRAILLGLEFLVAADIIATILIEPTITRAGALGIIVLIRTFLSFSLETEIEGCWPWERARIRNDPRSRRP